MLQSRVMQSTDPPARLLDEDGADITVTLPEPDLEPRVNGHQPAAPGSEAYVLAWDAYAAEEAEAKTRRQRSHTLRLAREVVETAIFALLMFLAVRTVVQNFRVEGASMDPTYNTGQYVLVNRALYARTGDLINWIPFVDADPGRHIFHGPERGDVVVFEPPQPNRSDRDFIKRIIGEPGDRVEVRDRAVFVNGRRLDEAYLSGVETTCIGQWCDVTLGPDEYFVMGDNRPFSSDSRFWGPVQGDKIVGKAWLIYLPAKDFGPAPNQAPALSAAE